jgi:predicted nucleic acid-binding protein
MPMGHRLRMVGVRLVDVLRRQRRRQREQRHEDKPNNRTQSPQHNVIIAARRHVVKYVPTVTAGLLTLPIHRRAERLMLSLSTPPRALDALHLATALDAEAATVVTFDPRLRDAAVLSQGLFVAPLMQ